MSNDLFNTKKFASELWSKMMAEKHLVSNPLGGNLNWDSGWPEPNDKIKFNPGTSVPSSMAPDNIVGRLLGPSHRFQVQVHLERWGAGNQILHIALLDTTNKEIVRFEEKPETFPSDLLIDKLRLLR